MIIDKKLTFADKLALSPVMLAPATTYQLGDILNVQRNIGSCGRLGLLVTFTTTVTAAGATTFYLQDCATEGGTYTTIGQTAALALANMVAGESVFIPLPPACRAFLRVVAVSATAVAVNGAVSLNITDGHDYHPALPDAL